jgi:CRP-like cAMP-binding protein
MAKSVPRPESWLATLPTELSHRLFANARPLSLAASRTLFVAGDDGDGCYRVEEGLLKASVSVATGGERILAILGPGSVVGELSTIDSALRCRIGVTSDGGVWVKFYFRSHSRLRCSRLPLLRPRHFCIRRSYARLSARAPWPIREADIDRRSWDGRKVP